MRITGAAPAVGLRRTLGASSVPSHMECCIGLSSLWSECTLSPTTSATLECATAPADLPVTACLLPLGCRYF